MEKEEGNKLFATGDWEGAKKKYDSGFVHIYSGKDEWNCMGDEQRRKILDAKLPLHLHRAMCKIKMGK